MDVHPLDMKRTDEIDPSSTKGDPPALPGR